MEIIDYYRILYYDEPIEWIDTSDIDAKEEFIGETFGRVNKTEAELTMAVLERYFEKIGKQRILDEHIDVGIISPYRAQVQYLRQQVKKRPFFNSGIHVQIGALPEDETIEFLQKHFATNNITIGDDEARYLIQCAANIPYYIQLLASFIWQRKVMNGGEIAVGDINDSVQDIIALKGDFYHEQFNRYSIGQKQLLRALSRDGSHIFSVDYIRRNKLNTSSTVQKNIKILLEDGIADKTGDTYFISDPFFRIFLQGI